MDADYEENADTMQTNKEWKKRSAFSKALHFEKPTFDPGNYW